MTKTEIARCNRELKKHTTQAYEIQRKVNDLELGLKEHRNEVQREVSKLEITLEEHSNERQIKTGRLEMKLKEEHKAINFYTALLENTYDITFNGMEE